MSASEFTWEGERILKRFERLPKAVQTGIVRGAARGLLLVEGLVQTQTDIRSRRGGAGMMGRLTSYSRAEGSDGVDAAIGFRRTNKFPYELSQEFGAKAKPGKAMAIPLTAKARALSSPREMAGLSLIKTPNNAVLAETSAKGKMIVHYVLVKSIPPRLKFRVNVRKGLPLFFREVVREHDREVLAT